MVSSQLTSTVSSLGGIGLAWYGYEISSPLAYAIFDGFQHDTGYNSRASSQQSEQDPHSRFFSTQYLWLVKPRGMKMLTQIK